MTTLRGAQKPSLRVLFAAIGGLVLLTAALTVGAAARPSRPGSSTVAVTAGKPTEFGFLLSTKSVKTGSVTFKITNKGALAHTFKICSSPKGGLANSCAGKGTPMISPKGSTTLTYTFKTKGSYEYLCTVPGHAAAGMKGDLKVT